MDTKPEVVICMADGCEEIEALTVVDLLRRAKIDICMASIHEKNEVTGSHQITIKTDNLLCDVSLENCQLIVLPGGKIGTENLFSNELVEKNLKQLYKEEKYLAAICAAPSVLGRHGLLNGKQATCYPGFEHLLTGAEYIENKKVVRDGRIITSRGMGTSIEFALCLISLLRSKELADHISESIIFK